jgi:glyoxylase-like metal-dependent hydrolase (beta-lactamase superfamily II)
VHSADRYRLADPWATLDPTLRDMLASQFGPISGWTEPDDIREFADGQRLDLAGLAVTVRHAPGHTEGSVLFELPALGGTDPQNPGRESASGPTVLTGDVLFAGSIGRTDLPGGSHTQMLATLRDKILSLPDDATILPGHGPATTMAVERARNPYLKDLN